MSDVGIIDPVRSVMSTRHRGLSLVDPVERLGDAQVGLIARSGLDPSDVGHLLWGCRNQLGTQAGSVTPDTGTSAERFA